MKTFLSTIIWLFSITQAEALEQNCKHVTASPEGYYIQGAIINTQIGLFNSYDGDGNSGLELSEQEIDIFDRIKECRESKVVSKEAIRFNFFCEQPGKRSYLKATLIYNSKTDRGFFMGHRKGAGLPNFNYKFGKCR